MTGAILAGLFCVLVLPSAAAQDSTVPHKSTRPRATKKSGNSSPSSAKKSATTRRSSTGKHPRGRSRKKRGQQAIDSPRARQIQEALIQQHYLDGEPSGKWDAATEAALRRFQSDQGWQTKTVPDSRALIKLGLGPSTDGLLNPESAMTTAPVTTATQKPEAPTKPATASKPQP